MKSFVLLIFGYLLIPFFQIIKKFIKFKITVLPTSRIGHLTKNFDVILLQCDDDTLIFIGQDKTIANKFIFNFFKKQKNVFFSRFFKYIYYAIFEVNPKSNLIITWGQFNSDFSYSLRYKSKISFPIYSQKEVNSIISKYDVNKNFVGLHARNNLYLEKYKLGDKNFHDYRNFSFNDYSLVIDYLAKKQISIIKLGETFPEENLNNFKTKIFTSVDFSSNEEIDYLLNRYSKYNVVGNTGVSNISSTLRKKAVYVNIIPFDLGVLSQCSPGSVILPKKIYSNDKKRFLTFKENNTITPNIHTSTDPYLRKNLVVINNTPQEILDAVIEMEKILLNQNKSKESNNLNNLFWKSMENKNNAKQINYLKNEVQLSISTEFLKNNQNLF